MKQPISGAFAMNRKTMSAEIAEMARTQIIQQTATGILAQANMQAQEVLKLVQ